MPRELFVLRKMGNEHSTTKLNPLLSAFWKFHVGFKMLCVKIVGVYFLWIANWAFTLFFFSSKMAQMEDTMFIAAELTIHMCWLYLMCGILILDLTTVAFRLTARAISKITANTLFSEVRALVQVQLQFHYFYLIMINEILILEWSVRSLKPL